MLCFCLLPAFALADINDGTPVTHSEFDVTLRLNPAGFPNDGAAHYQDWAEFLGMLSVKGVVDAQSFPMPLSRVRMDAALCLNGEETIPFAYDGYCNYRYVRSPALGGASVHFQMINFFQFMLKPYYYMGLPTNYIALPLYPEAAIELYQLFAPSIQSAFAGEGTRTVPYEEMYALSQELSQIFIEDPYYKISYYLTCALADVGLDYTLLDKGCYMEGWLEYLDPNHQGMTITVDGGRETWVLGETVVFEKDGSSWRLYLPDEEGYEYIVEWTDNGTDILLNAEILFEGESYLKALLTVDGLGDPLMMQGTATLSVTGSGLYTEPAPLSFAYSITRTAETLPYDLTLSADWINPATNAPAIGFTFSAAMTELPHTVLTDRAIDDQVDFFSLNGDSLEEYKSRFLPTVALSALPIALSVPAGVISDVVSWLDNTGFLLFFGLE